MAAPKKSKQSIIKTGHGFDRLVGQLRGLILESRRQLLRTVDVMQVRTCWEVGRHIVEFEQEGAERAEYGTGLLRRLADKLTAEFGRGYDASNLYKMRQFHAAFSNLDAVRPELSWTHYRLLLRVDDEGAREWYVQECIAQNWSTRALERQIGCLYYERLLTSRNKKAVKAEAVKNLALEAPSPRDFIRDPVVLEFLGLPGTGKLLESRLENSLVGNLQSFLLELGKGFAFVARQQRLSTETKDFYVDLVFYNYVLKCFVLFDLKPGNWNIKTLGRWTCTCACMTSSTEDRATDPPWASFCARTKMPAWYATPCYMAMSSFLPANTVSCCPAKTNCEPS